MVKGGVERGAGVHTDRDCVLLPFSVQRAFPVTAGKAIIFRMRQISDQKSKNRKNGSSVDVS